MSKLSLDALKERAEAIASVDLLNSISGGTKNSCHPGDKVPDEREEAVTVCDNI